MVTELSLRNEDSNQVAGQEAESFQQYLQAATSDNTRKAYQSAIRQFEKWGGRLPTDRDTVVRYLLARAESRNPEPWICTLPQLANGIITKGSSIR
ncbi:hypothetical protein P4S73_02955 [Paraglaciecola sp. Hal342]